VRIGNAAHTQLQLDIYGELIDSAHIYRKFGGEFDPIYWEYFTRVVNFVIENWREPDEGIWETRGGPRHFVFSKVMCWVALDRAIKAARALNLAADIERWRTVRTEIREDVLQNGYDPNRDAFVQSYGSKNLDASTLMLPLVRFIRADDPRMRSTIEAIERELTSPHGLVYRYRNFDDGLAGDEGTFVMCTYWLADNLIELGQLDRARALFEKLNGYRNDLGLFAEQIHGDTGELLGNFPQAFSHMALINTAVMLQRGARRRAAAQAAPDEVVT
jgi:GH15 family glucan-1,4-alpha-glucosidase